VEYANDFDALVDVLVDWSQRPILRQCPRVEQRGQRESPVNFLDGVLAANFKQVGLGQCFMLRNQHTKHHSARRAALLSSVSTQQEVHLLVT
jgi:hypothetical protein